MREETPVSSLSIQANATALTLATTATLFNQLATAVTVIDTASLDGDVSVRADKANNRFLVLPGTYKVSVDLSGTIDGTQDITLDLRKNGVADPAFKSKRSWTVTVQNSHVAERVIKVLATDVPNTIANFPDTTAPTAPAVSFTGGTGSPKQMVPIDFTLTSGAGTPAITVANGAFTIERLA